MYAALPEFVLVSRIIVPYGFLLAYALYSVRCILEGYQVLLAIPLDGLQIAGTNTFAMLAWMLSFLTSMWWFYKKFFQPRSKKLGHRPEMTDGEYQTYVYAGMCIATSVAVILCNYIFAATSWTNANEACLVSYVFIQFCANVLMIGSCVRYFFSKEYLHADLYFHFPLVLPGRVQRMRAFTNVEITFVKQVFVRYVSHEIRY